MPAAKTTSKRKKTADMPDSPPKRVTRARAKATTDDAPRSKTTKIVTESAKIGTKKAATPKPIAPKPAAPRSTTASKRKTRADDEAEAANEQNVTEEELQPEPLQSNGRVTKPSKATTAESTKDADAPVKAARGRQPRATKAEEPKPEVSINRGRAKKVVQSANTADEKAQEQSAPPKRTTRGRPATSSTKTVANPTAKMTAAKKRVKFQDEQELDKENVPVEAEAPKNAPKKAMGLKAQPVRKPVVRATARGKKINKDVSQAKDDPKVKEAAPLSPKKVIQVAKSGSSGSEDELAGEKTPMRALSKSPVKPPPSISINMDRAAPKLDLTAEAVAPSRSELQASSIFTSPARRPPPSPFKDALKGSPKRINFAELPAQPEFKASNTQSNLYLLQSPKRVNFTESQNQADLKSSQTPLKASSLQSPARRPATSPRKYNVLLSPGKSSTAVPVIHAATVSKQVNTFKLPQFSPKKFVSSPLRAARSPESPVRVHKMTPIEQKELDEYYKAASDGMGTPSRSSKKAALPLMDCSVSNLARNDDPNEPAQSASSPTLENTAAKEFGPPDDEALFIPENVEDLESEENEENDFLGVQSVTPRPSESASRNPSYPFSTSFYQSTPNASESEDELTISGDAFAPTPLSNYRISTTDFGVADKQTPNLNVLNKKSRKGVRQSGRASTYESTSHGPSMTPLAMQLSSWLASSPEKKNAPVGNGASSGIFSFVSPTNSADNEARVSASLAESPLKTKFFEDEMAVTTLQDDEADQKAAINGPTDEDELQISQDFCASEEYGDENAIPVDPTLLAEHHEVPAEMVTCTPAKVFSQHPREICVVSKVPLRPAGDESPRKAQRLRSRSLSHAPRLLHSPEKAGSKSARKAAPFTQKAEPPDAGSLEVLESEEAAAPGPATPSIVSTLDLETPLRSAAKRAPSSVLKGAVVYVDVHTTEGADASSLFIELLTQMGARCVKQWNWNPRASAVGLAEDSASGNGSPEFGTPASKIGITHVVFKDGGKRTLEKVRESKGVVLCVGVNWVLE